MSRLLVALAVVGATAAPAAATPTIAYWGGAGPSIRTSDLDGTVRASIHGVPYWWVSIAKGLVLGTRDTKVGYGQQVIAWKAVGGDRRFTIDDARISLIHPGGKRIVFTPDNNGGRKHDRDPRVNSVWVRNVHTGAEKQVARFPDIGPVGRNPIDLAWNPQVTRIAVGHGNDGELYAFDIWTASATRKGTLRRLTTGGFSRYPSFSPDGSWIAYTYRRWNTDCVSQVRLIRPNGTGEHTLVGGTCHRILYRPVWISSHALVAWWVDQKGPRGLVRINATTGHVTTLVRAHVWAFQVSRTLGKVIWRTGNGAIHLYDLSTRRFRKVPGGTTLPGDVVAIQGQLEQ